MHFRHRKEAINRFVVALSSNAIGIRAMTRVMRILGMITGAMVFWQLGPEHIWGEATGHIVALVKKFPLRTIITLPIILGIAHWFVF